MIDLATLGRLTAREVILLRIHDLGLVAPKVRVAWVAAGQSVQSSHRLDMVPLETLRVAALQREYCKTGASKQADVLYSSHGLGVAIDGISNTRQWALTDEEWAAYGEALEAHGLVWGGRWTSPNDPPHGQCGAIAGKPPESLVQIYRLGGLAGVWEELGLIR